MGVPRGQGNGQAAIMAIRRGSVIPERDRGLELPLPVVALELQEQRGIGILITDHNVRETLEIIDRAYIMHDGQVLMEGRPDEVVAHADVRRVYLGERFSL